MAPHFDPTDADISKLLEAEENKNLLRFITCGSVDDGKSTLIGRLIYETRHTLKKDLSPTEGKLHEREVLDIDLALMVDGLRAEREQGITIDVAYCFFSTEKRKFIAADAPGHEQYTRNMATGASTAMFAVILVDARKGILTQTRRHSFIVHLLGIRHAILAVNKMDLVGWNERKFEEIADEYREFASELGMDQLYCLPISALSGENVFGSGLKMPWYRGPTLIGLLETIDVDTENAQRPFRMPVQWINRNASGFRGFAGTVASGTVRTGDRVLVCPSNRETTVERVVTYDGDLSKAGANQAITVLLGDQVDVGRGDILGSFDDPPASTNQFVALLLWVHDKPLLPERRYLLKIGSAVRTAQVTALHYKISFDTMEHIAAQTLAINEVASCNFALDRQIAFDPYRKVRETGGFILIDYFGYNTVGAGMILSALRRAKNVVQQNMDVSKRQRVQQKGQRPCILWFTGLSAAGKSTVANRTERTLAALGLHSYLLDGDNVRLGLNKDLGFSDADRVENIRRIAEVAKLFIDSGLIVLVSCISPFRDERIMAREMVEKDEFIEIFVDAPLEVCERRDPKGLYKKARAGEIRNFTGIHSIYEVPENPEITLRTNEFSIECVSDQVIGYLENAGYLNVPQDLEQVRRN